MCETEAINAVWKKPKFAKTDDVTLSVAGGQPAEAETFCSWFICNKIPCRPHTLLFAYQKLNMWVGGGLGERDPCILCRPAHV